MAKFALLIGVSEYEPGLSPLPAAVKDVAAFQRILQDAEMGGFDEVKTLINPDPQSMQYAIETLFTGHSKDDLELLFFSGHGIKDDNNSLHFATRITSKNPKGDLIRSMAVPARFIREVMDNSRTKRQVIILDCCFSGAFDPSLQSKDDGSIDLPGQLGAEGRVVLTSSSSTQYSFEQQGSELSLYTRYLVEGIETGAGDLDEDGKISMRELHDYATSKVQETSPNMTPKLITLKDMGFEIVLAKAKVTDPKLRYRRQVERYSCNGSISSIGQTILCELQAQLGLSAQVAEEIEGEILKPYQDRLNNLQRYQQAFSKAIEHEYPLSSQFESELRDLRDVLGLREEDVSLMQNELISRQQNENTSKKTENKSLERVIVVEDSGRLIQDKIPSKKKQWILFGGVAGILAVILLVGLQFQRNTSSVLKSNCEAEILGSIRSEPSSQAGDDTVLGSGGTLPVTGVKTEGGWIQVNRSNKNAWVYSEKISNFNQLQSCFSKTVSDDQFIKSNPKIKVVAPSPKTVESTPVSPYKAPLVPTTSESAPPSSYKAGSTEAK
jgi:uncharacterized caspase-like protein/uncharacterized protein YraI